MKDYLDAASEGFFGSFVLAGVIVVSVAAGLWRVTGRILDAFVHHKPLAVGHGKTIEFP